MKKILIIIISIFIMPILVNAETMEINICKNGCDYNSLDQIMRTRFDGTPIDLIINFKDENIYREEQASFSFSNENVYKFSSVTINGNGATLELNDLQIAYIKTLKLNDININIIGDEYTSDGNVIIGPFNSIDNLGYSSYEINNCKITYRKTGRGRYNVLIIAGNNGTIKNCDISIPIAFYYGTFNVYDSIINDIAVYSQSFSGETTALNIHNSSIQKVANYSASNITPINIYNSKFNSLKYINIVSENGDATNEYLQFLSTFESSVLHYDIYDFDGSNNNQGKTITKIYFDKEAEVKVNDKLNLVNYLDYYTEDKEISYTIEDETIAKIENKELIGLKPGNTKVQVTTDEGHVIYNIDLTVYTISEKKVSMKAQNKLKLNSVFKDLDISSVSDDVWEISNPSVAKVVNGEIISLSKGTTDITGIVNGVKYIYHLTVSDTLVSKEIKVPITGKSIKLWIVIVTILFLGVIGVCSYMLIKKRK